MDARRLGLVSQEIETGTSDLQARLEDRVLTLTMNRPAARNALTVEMLEALSVQLARAESDDEVGCIVLTGSDKAFCAGGDVKAMAGSDEDAGQFGPSAAGVHRQRVIQRATAGKLASIPKPTIAAVNGAAAGAGLSLALACDLRVMSPSAFFLTAFAKVGLSGDFGGTYFLSQIVGTAKARELYFLSERIDANESLRLGLATRVFEADCFASETAALAARLATGPTVALRFIKENLNRALIATMEECLDLEATHHIHCTTTQDHTEAAAAFVEKRAPVFRGS